MLNLQIVLNKLVKLVQIYVGKQLACHIAQW